MDAQQIALFDTRLTIVETKVSELIKQINLIYEILKQQEAFMKALEKRIGALESAKKMA